MVVRNMHQAWPRHPEHTILVQLHHYQSSASSIPSRVRMNARRPRRRSCRIRPGVGPDRAVLLPGPETFPAATPGDCRNWQVFIFDELQGRFFWSQMWSQQTSETLKIHALAHDPSKCRTDGHSKVMRACLTSGWSAAAEINTKHQRAIPRRLQRRTSSAIHTSLGVARPTSDWGRVLRVVVISAVGRLASYCMRREAQRGALGKAK